MIKRRMKQRVAVTLATVWLASIVGASVPSGETTAFSTHHPSGPSPDQYTPLLRNPRYYSQDDYGQDWMNDEPSRIKVANRHEKLKGQRPITDSDISLPIKSATNEFYDRKIVKEDEDVAVPYSFQSKDVKIESDLEKEAMRLSSMKVAFDEPIDSEQSADTSSEEDWQGDSIEDEEAMQQDEFISDGTFEDEGPGSVEVYKLDLYKDGAILSPKPSRKNWLKSKSKIPKKVEASDQINWKRKELEESKQPLPKTVSRIDYTHTEEMSVPSKSLKDRIFGTGGVPELQVGCEGVEGSQRQKRSDSEESTRRKSKSDSDESDKTSARATQLYIDADYDSEEELDAIGGTDELFRILNEAKTTTDSSLINENRGDMDPRVKTPGDLELAKKKDKLPTRGDLGPSGDPNLTEANDSQQNGTKEEQSQVNSRRKLLALEEEEEEEEEEEVAENFRSKRSSDESLNGNSMKEGEKRVRRGHRGHHGTRRHKEGKRRRRHEGRGEREWLGNEIRKRNKGVDKNVMDYRKEPEYDNIRENRLVSDRRRNEDYRRGYEQQINAEKRSEKERRTADENEKKLENYKRRNTPIPRGQRPEDHHQRRQEQKDQLAKQNSNTVGSPQNLRLGVPPVHGHHGKDRYAEDRRRLLEQIRGETGHMNKTAYQQELAKQQKEQSRLSAERPQNQRQGKSVLYTPRSQKEIDRLNALPISAYIIINQPKPNTKGPQIEDRFGGRDEITFPGLTVGSDGLKVPNFPSPATTSPPVAGPSPCTWAVIACCSMENQLARCFEAKGCSQGHWDDPCSQDKILAALQMVNQHYGG